MRKLLISVAASVVGFIAGSQENKNTERELYLTKLKAAEAFFRLNEIPEAKKLIGETKPSQRGWEWNFMQARMDRSVQVFSAHSKPAVGIAVSKDGKIMATGSADSKIILWNAENNQQIMTIEGHASQVTTLDFSPDGKWLVSGSTDKTLRLWDINSGKELRNYNTEFSRGIYQVRFSPDGIKLGVVSWELSAGNKFPVIGFAKVIDVQTGKVLNRFDLDSHPVSALDFSADNKNLLSATWGMLLDYHELKTGKKNWNYDLNNLGYYAAIQSADISPDDKKIITGGKDSRIRIYDAFDGKLLLLIEPAEGHNAIVNTVRFSPDGKWFASAGDDGLLMIWETSTGKRLYTFRGHDGPVNQIAWHPDSKIVYTSSYDNTVRKWEIDRPGEISFDVCINGPWYAPVSSDGNYLAAACSDKRVGVWEINKAGLLTSFDSINANCAVFSNDGKYLYSASHDKLVRGFDLQLKKEIFSAKGHTNSVYGIAVCDNKGIVASAGDNAVRIWDMKTGNLLQALVDKASTAYAVKFSSDGKKLFAGLSNGKINIYSTSDWALTDTLSAGNSIYNMDIDPSGIYLVTTGQAGQVFVCDIISRKVKYQLQGHTKDVYGVAVHPEKPLVMTGSYDKKVKLWDMNTGECLLTLGGFNREIFTLSFAKDGNRVVITETEGLVHLIDL